MGSGWCVVFLGLLSLAAEEVVSRELGGLRKFHKLGRKWEL